MPRPRIAEHLTSQALAGEPLGSPEAVAERLLAVQGQDPRGARLAVRARTEGLTAAEVDRALDGRSLLITWLNRGTLHLVRSADYPWLHALTAPTHLASCRRRLQQEGIPEGAACCFPSIGPRTTIPRAAPRNIRWMNAYVLVRDWLGEPPPVDREKALAELARRYLLGHAPADDGDLARWAGLPLRDARAGLAAIASELEQRQDGLVELKGSPDPAPLPPPRLLGAFDPLLLGWASREEVVGPHRVLVTTNGIFRPFALVRGRAVARWGLAAGKVSIEHLDEVREKDAAALEEDARRVLEFLGESESARSVE